MSFEVGSASCVVDLILRFYCLDLLIGGRSLLSKVGDGLLVGWLVGWMVFFCIGEPTEQNERVQQVQATSADNSEACEVSKIKVKRRLRRATSTTHVHTHRHTHTRTRDAPLERKHKKKTKRCLKEGIGLFVCLSNSGTARTDTQSEQRKNKRPIAVSFFISWQCR